MAEKIVFDKLLSILASTAIQQIQLAWGVEDELRRLEANVTDIKHVLSDAQKRQTSSDTVRGWLQRLKDILCDAENLFDEIATETKKMENQNRLVREVRYFFTSSNSFVFRRKMGSKIKDILKRLEESHSQMHPFEFMVNQAERPIETLRKETTPLGITRRIIGREDDKKELVKLLVSFGNQEDVLVIPIVGIGGLGKTTLAQLVYDDDSIQEHFPKRLWVSVSTDFDTERLLIKILQAGGEWDDKFRNNGFQELQNRVISLLGANKFLLFLDDVWNADAEEWNKLEALLIRGASGSRIVVTTRNMTVASIVRTSIVEPYKLRGLSDEESSTLLKKLAFKEGEEKQYENLVNIGKEIVKKCEGVPLAVVTLGVLLFSKRDGQDWLSMRDNEMLARAQQENDFLPVLRLSYDQMSPNLKQCFAYCSLFERDEIIDGKKLIYAWMAQGYIQRVNRNDVLEDVGKSYIDALVNMFFLETYDGRTLSKSTGREHYKMTGLVHSLAQDVAGDECLTIRRAVTDLNPGMLRHVAFESETSSEFPIALMEAKKLRTIFNRSKKNRPFGSESTSFRYLRVCEDLISSPKKIRKLKLLRYLGLNGVDNLPKSLCKLLNLLYLDLSMSEDVKLPKDFEKLSELRFLCLSTKLEHLPNKGIGKLTCLRTLIISNCEALKSLDEAIGQLSCLRELAIESCSKLRSLPAGFKNLTSLERLEIRSCLLLNLSDLEGLTSLRQLKLRNILQLASLPEGLVDSAGSLAHLEIEWCRDFTSPSDSVLPKLKSLESLKIWDCKKVGSLPEGMQGLTRLRCVSIVGCPLFKTNYEAQAAEMRKIAHVRKIDLS